MSWYACRFTAYNVWVMATVTIYSSTNSMSKNPSATEIDANLMHLLESSLEVQCLIAGSNTAVLRQQAMRYPYTLIGQNVETTLTVRSSRGKSMRITPGGGYILPEGQLLNIGATDNQAMMYRWSHFRFRVLGNLDLFEIVQSPYGLAPEYGERIGQLNLELASIFAQPGDDMLVQIARRKLAAAKMLMLVLELCPASPGAMQKLVLVSRFEKVFSFVKENIDRPMFRDELSDIACLSPSRFHAGFLEATGLSPMAYVTQLRLRKAQELLLGSVTAVHEIALAVGFCDPFHFSRTFSKHVGLSPSGYRQRGRSGLMHEMHEG